MPEDVLRRVGAPVGTVIDGKYRIDGVLGKGGFGVVASARHEVLDRRVAVKILAREGLDPTSVQRFINEAQAASKINSEHVVRVFDVGTLDDDGAPFMVMEHLEGTDLANVLRRDGVVPVPQAAAYALEAIEALAQAHRLGIVHRDLKLANLFRSERPDGSHAIKVLDFGISKLARDGETLTTLDDVFGTPTYMAPELWVSASNADARSDIWALGVILYALTTGEVPFEGANPAEQCQAILNDEPVPPHVLEPAIDPALSDIVARCLQKRPSDRYPDVAALAWDLAELAPERSRVHAERAAAVLARDGAATVELPGATATPDEPTADTRLVEPPETSGRLGWVLAFAAAGVVGVVVFASGGDEEEVSAAATTASAAATSSSATATGTSAAAPSALANATAAPAPPTISSSAATAAATSSTTTTAAKAAPKPTDDLAETEEWRR